MLSSNSIIKVNMDLCDIWTNISETVHLITNVSMEDI